MSSRAQRSEVLESGARCPSEDALLAFADGLLALPERARLERHVDGCEDCSALLAEALRASTPTGAQGPRTGVDTRERDDASARALRAALVDGAGYGQRIGRYVLLEHLGRGGMGVVYTAYDPELARTIALKLIRPGREREREARRARVLREAQAAARLEHANVVTVYEIGEWAGVDYIALEYVAGTTARAWMRARGRPQPWRDVLRVFLEAGEGLAAAHRAGVLHRDFKPGNILLDRDGHAKVADFGLATSADDDARDDTLESLLGASQRLELAMTRTGTLLGTPPYMAPEQHESARVDARADQYSFAVSLYEALYGARPFTGDTPEQLLAAKRARTFARGPGRACRAGSAPWCCRALEPTPSRRWPDMPAMLAALRANPARRRGWTAALALAAAATIAGLGYRARARAQIIAGCEDRRDVVLARWTDDRAARIGEAFAATGLGYAADSWARARPQAAAYAATLAAAREAMCRGGELAGEVEASALARAYECLDRAEDALERLADEWEDADEQRVTRAPERATALPRVEDCTSLELLRRRVALEPADADPQALASLRARQHEADRLLHVYKPREALALADEVAREAESIGARGLAAQALQVECKIKEAFREYDNDEAVAACTRAVTLAMRAEDHETAARSAASLAIVYSQGGSPRGTADAWLRVAEAQHGLIERQGPDPTRALLRQIKGYVAQDYGETEAAVAAFREAIGEYEAIHGGASVRGASAWSSIAFLSINAGDLEAADVAASEATRIREQVFGPNHPLTLESDEYRAYIAADRDPDEGERLFLANNARRAEVMGEAAAARNRGAFRLGTWKGCARSRPAAEEAVAALERVGETGDKFYVQLLLRLGACQRDAGELARARATGERALAALSAHDEPTRGELEPEARALASAVATAE
ncbi:MAG: protein kinase [Myxococcales bacterium]|nr:protein kinase [Myxococcales bacterium]